MCVHTHEQMHTHGCAHMCNHIHKSTSMMVYTEDLSK